LPAIARISWRFIANAFKSQAGQYIKDRSTAALADLLAQFFAHRDFGEVDWVGVVANYATPFKGATGFIINNTLKNGLDAAVDYQWNNGFKAVFLEADYKKEEVDAFVDLFVSQVVDNLSGAFKVYLEAEGKFSKEQISNRVKGFGITVKEYLDNRIKIEIGRTGKGKTQKEEPQYSK